MLATSEPDFGSVSAKAAMASPRARLLQPRALLGRAEERDRAGAEPLHGEGEIGEAVVAGERLAREAERAHIGRAVAVGGRGVIQTTVAAETRDEIAAGGIHVGVIDRQVFRAPFLQRRVEGAVAILEKRPGEKALVRHQSPSKTGFSLATKAR